MNLIGCLDTPSKGSYLLNDKEVASMNDDELARIRNEEIGFVFQTFNLLPRATALHNVELPLIYGGVPSKERQERARGRWRKSSSPRARRTGRTSCPAVSGSASRFARALVNNPSILLADEPTGNLDSKTGIEIMGVFERLHSAGNTIVLVTHEADIAAYAHRTIAIRDGLVEKDTRRVKWWPPRSRQLPTSSARHVPRPTRNGLTPRPQIQGLHPKRWALIWTWESFGFGIGSALALALGS
jgi:putative ABC transport system ATP-binding protein